MTANQLQISSINRIASRLHINADTLAMHWVESGHAKHWRIKFEKLNN